MSSPYVFYEKIKRINRRELFMVAMALIFICAQVWLDLKVPDYMADVTKRLQNPDVKVPDVLIPGIKIIALALI